MKETFTFTAKTYPKCDDYLRIRWDGEEYKKIEDFICLHPEAEESELDVCMVNYRGVEKTYKEFIKDYSTFAYELKFVEFNPYKIIANKSIRASKYFVEKTIDAIDFDNYTLQFGGNN